MSGFIKQASEQFAETIETTLTKKEKKKIARRVDSVLISGGLLLVGIFYGYLFPSQEALTALILLIGAIIAGFHIFKKAVNGFLCRKSTCVMEQLVSIALIASMAKGDYMTAILIPMIMAVVHFLEERSILGAKSVIEGLKTLQAKTARVETAEGEKNIETINLEIGNILIVKPGEVIPADGDVVKGSSSINQSSLTGENLPVDVKEGQEVFAGTINIQGLLKIKVTKKMEETSLSKIVNLLKETEKSKTSTMRIMEKYISYYLPLVIIIVTGVLFATMDINRAIAILVVSCPCAQLLVSTTAMVVALSVSSRNGILLKNSKFLEVLGDVKTIIFDKTGTLTSGELNIKSIKTFSSEGREKVLFYAATAAYASNHPVSKAIVKSAGKVKYLKDVEIIENAGLGVTANIAEGEIIIGKTDWFIQKGFEMPEMTEHAGSVVWVAFNKKVVGCILLEDHIRQDAKIAIKTLKEIGVDRTLLVTGDRTDATIPLKKEIELDDVFAECLPGDKLKIVVKEKRKKAVTMVVGDGINDALALSKADVGVAMGAMGSDIAVQSSDIALMGNELKKIPFVIELSRRTRRIIYQNMIFASISSLIMIILAGFAIVTPLLGAFLHNIGAFLVVFNSGRLFRFDSK